MGHIVKIAAVCSMHSDNLAGNNYIAYLAKSTIYLFQSFHLATLIGITLLPKD